VFGKKNEIERKVPGKKNQSVLGVGYTVSWAPCLLKIQSPGLIGKLKRKLLLETEKKMIACGGKNW
jgi:hypothetical protein